MKKLGLHVRTQETADLQRCMLQCGMSYLSSSECLFTWKLRYPSAMAHFMPEGSFDHSPTVVNVYPQIEPGKQPFIYFIMWSKAANFNSLITEC